LDTTPFEALYGYNYFRLEATNAVTVVEMSKWLQQKDLITQLIQQHLA
jgi:hypothetical protein